MTLFRVWSEYLPMDRAIDDEVVSLLSTYKVHPTFAIHHHMDAQDVAQVLLRYQREGLHVGIWPLMSDEQGYWPSEQNGAMYFAHVTELLNALERCGVKPGWLAVDLEPPLHQMNQLRHVTSPLHKSLISIAKQNLNATAFGKATGQFEEGVMAIRERGWKSYSVALPLVAHDLRDDYPLWQDLLESPWEGVSWDRAGIMAYGSMVMGYSRGWFDEADVRAMHYRLFLHLVRRFGSRAHVSLGITGTGKLGDEPVYTSPEPLAMDVSAARAAGIEDIGIFCLEGILQQSDPEWWLSSIVNARPRTPEMTLRAQGARLGGWFGRKLIRTLSDLR